ncbi:MAG TPA: hypothetical protein VKH35_07815 [Thermoanaerobaculia bacterium]|nr:hypothetical protein [Thermoanaerobaculia bacterium]
MFFLVLALVVPSFAVAGDAPQASGKFKGAQVSFDVTGAYAYWSRSSDAGPVIVVAVSNDPFNTAAFDGFYDPEPVINMMFVDERTAVVYFQFEPNGSYHGLSYQIAEGDNCGFCRDAGVKSSVRITGNRAAGKISYKGDRRTFDIQFDVPVAPKVWGKPLASDGGDPGRAYRAYNVAMEKGDRKAIFALLDSSNQATWSRRVKEGKLESYLDYRSDKVHWNLKEAQIMHAYERGNQALLLIKGSSALLDHIHGQVSMMKENGKWKVSDEIYQVGE